MSGGFQSVPFPVSGFHYPYPVQQQNPMVVMSSPQFPVQVQPAQSQFIQPQLIPQTSQFGQSMVLIPLDVGQQQSLFSAQFPQNINPGSVPTPPSSYSGSEIISESTVTEQSQKCSCSTECSNQTHGGGYYLLEPVFSIQTDQNPTGEIGNVQQSSLHTSANPTCQCERCSGRLSSAPSSSLSSINYTNSNGVTPSPQQHSVPLPTWNFPLQQPVYQYFVYPVQPTPLQFPSIPMSNFDERFENFYRTSSVRKDTTWSKGRKNPQPPTTPKPMCGFCKSNREPKEVYRGHWLRNDAGDLTCPSLRKYVCPVCQATGDNAHTIKYCPVAPAPNKDCTSSLESENCTIETKDKENYIGESDIDEN